MLTALAKDLEERFHDKNAEHTYLEIAHTCNEEGAKELEEALKEQYPGAPITIAPLSLSIACHIGPGSFAVACSSKLVYQGFIHLATGFFIYFANLSLFQHMVDGSSLFVH